MLFIEYSGKDDDELAGEDNPFDISLYDESVNQMEIKDELDLFFDVILANLNSQICETYSIPIKESAKK
jgi:hypothetical protein